MATATRPAEPTALVTDPQPESSPNPVASPITPSPVRPLDPADELLLLGHRRRISVDLHRRMAEAGILTPEDRVELIEGVLVEKTTKNPPHVVATMLIERLLHRLLPDGWIVTAGNPVTIPERDGEPEPDIQVVRGDPRDYLERRVGSGDAVLVIEVADASYTFDRRIKWLTYGAGGLPVYWLVDLNRRLLEIHTEPSPEGYRSLRTLGPDDEAIIVLDGHEIGRLFVRDILL